MNRSQQEELKAGAESGGDHTGQGSVPDREKNEEQLTKVMAGNLSESRELMEEVTGCGH